MAIRPPRAGFSVSRRMSERARAAAEPKAEGADIGGIFSGLRGLMEQFAEAAKTSQDEISRTVELGGDKARMVFGYTLRMGPDGIDAQPFGNVTPEKTGPKVAPALQPITEVYQDGDTVVVVAELPGADAGGIVCTAAGSQLLVETTLGRRYRKELDLPAAVRAEGIRQTYQNGILEVRLQRAATA